MQAFEDKYSKLGQSSSAANTENTQDLTSQRLALIEKHNQAFNNKDFNSVHEIMDPNVYASTGDGTDVTGPTSYIQMLKIGQQISPDTRIIKTEASYGCGDWTTTTSVMEGTFTGRMPAPTGWVEPTGKKWQNRLCVLAKWRGLKIIEEYSYWETSMTKAMS